MAAAATTTLTAEERLVALLDSAEERLVALLDSAEELVGEDDLPRLLRDNPRPVCLDGFEPSGAITIAQGVGTAIRARAMVRAGCRVKLLLADCFALLNKRLDGDPARIWAAARRMVEVWRALGVGVDGGGGGGGGGGGVEVLWSSEEIIRRSHEYWSPLVMDIAQRNSVKRIRGCCALLDREKKEELSAGQFLYPIMQCADVFFFQADICHMAMDQREVNMLARDYCNASGRSDKPIILSYHMLPGIKQGQKMSNRDPSSAIFVEDSESEVNKKIRKAFCPPGIVAGNPCLEYIKYIVFPWLQRFDLLRTEANGGNKTYSEMQDVSIDYASGALHPADVKSNLAKAINQILQPVRDHLIHFKRVDQMEICPPDYALKKFVQPFESNNDAEVFNNSFKSSLSTTNDLRTKVPAITPEERFRILKSIAEECINEGELKELLQKKPNPICYDGFEPSGSMHIAQGVGKVVSINKMLGAGCQVKIWIADWFAMLNQKMGGNLNKIQTVGNYMITIWKALGIDMDRDRVEFLWASKEIDKRRDEYWSLVFDIALKSTFSRIVRCCQIMGRGEKETLTASQILYPLMQCADIFFLKVDICQMGTDQRKVNMLAREYCESKSSVAPIILSHHMLPDIKEGQQKMSKSDPASAIFMEDDESEVKHKIEQAFCPRKIIKGNPCLEYIEYIIFPWFKRFEVLRKEADGGNKTYNQIEELNEDYSSGNLHPDDVKRALAKAINEILQPVRDHFRNNPDAEVLRGTVKAYRKTNGFEVQSSSALDHIVKELEQSSI